VLIFSRAQYFLVCEVAPNLEEKKWHQKQKNFVIGSPKI
jgi:hypothetical protein